MKETDREGEGGGGGGSGGGRQNIRPQTRNIHNSRVSDQNGVSRLYTIVEIYTFLVGNPQIMRHVIRELWGSCEMFIRQCNRAAT